MSAYVLDKKNIELLTQATDAALRMAKQYPGSYHLSADTLNILGQYAGDLHNLYRALYITNIKAVNGRYGEDTKTLPKYTTLHPWSTDHLDLDALKRACGMFGCYMYQCSEDPIYGTPIYSAFADIKNFLCGLFFSKTYGWGDE